MPTVGVLALQGDVREHVRTLTRLGATTREVRSPEQLEDLDALVMPGGESTAIAHLLATAQMKDVLGDALTNGLGVLATCAGLILLAHDVLDGRSDQWSYDVLDVDVRRNGYGRQISSFEADLEVSQVGCVRGVFIRAPRIERVGDGVEVLANLIHDDAEHAVMVRRGRVIGCAFHPELTNDDRVHRLFLEGIS